MKNFHFLFEQSGTFKNVFKKYGFNCFDYDLFNEFNETDYIVDLFKEIENEYCNITNKSSFKTIFTDMTPDNDFIIAFFPCTYFCDRNQLIFKLYYGTGRYPINMESINRVIERNKNRAYYFEIYLKFLLIVSYYKIRTIIENPASGGSTNYLAMFSPVDISFCDKNRALFGDDFKKPTNFFSLNFDMKETFSMFYDYKKPTKTVNQCKYGSVSTGGRSLITEVYADNFYKRFIQNNI